MLMFQRYLNNYNLHLFVTVYTWDNERATELRDFENTTAYDFNRQEWVEEKQETKDYERYRDSSVKLEQHHRELYR